MRIEIRKKKIGIVVFMDLLLIFMMGWGISGDKFPTLTMFQRVLIGIGCAVIFLGLYFIKIIGSILRVLCSLFWSEAIFSGFGIPFDKWTNNSKIWMIIIRIVLFLIFLSIHMRFHEDWKDDFSDDSSEHQFISGKREEK